MGSRHSTLVALSVQRHYFHADPPVITLRNYRIYIPNRNRWIQIGMSGMPQEYRTEGKKARELTWTCRRALSLHEGDPYRTSRHASSFSPDSLFSHRALLQSGWREAATDYQFYRIKTGSSVTPIRSYPRYRAQHLRGEREWERVAAPPLLIRAPRQLLFEHALRGEFIFPTLFSHFNKHLRNDIPSIQSMYFYFVNIEFWENGVQIKADVFFYSLNHNSL